MPYSAEISRSNPTALIFLLDQSGSMSQTMHGDLSLAQFLSDAVNRALLDVIVSCTRGGDDVRNFFHIAALGYGNNGVRNIWNGALAGEFFQPVATIADNPARIEQRRVKVSDGAGGIIEENQEFEIWCEPGHNGNTPMTMALTQARDLVSGWVAQHPTAYPPTILHVTDGEPTDGNPETVAREISSISTHDGGTLLFNLHISRASPNEILFPAFEAGLPDENARTLFRMSSLMPQELMARASEYYSIAPGSRFFGYNAGAEAIVRFFQIGTRPVVRGGAAEG